LNVFRPADTIETLECWEIALKSSTNPSVIALSRQKIPFVTEVLAKRNMSNLGGYELKKTNLNPEVTLIASGSEVQIAIEALNKLQEININSKVISMPCQELFDKQSKEYKEKIIDKNSIKISIEASSIYGWEKYVGPDGISLGIKSFGKSAPYKKIYEHFNLTSDNVVKLAKKMLGK
jgi:transketolase